MPAGCRSDDVMKTFFSLTVFSLCSMAMAANVYIRQGASGSRNGSDWANAYTNIPPTLTRGNTYYIADGSYGDYTVNAPADGTNFIHFKKATLSDHGTDAGWDNAYGDGQAFFHTWRFNINQARGNAGYMEINGYSPHVTNYCGFKWKDLTIQQQAFIWDWASGNWPEMRFRYCEVAGPMTGGDMRSSDNPPWSYAFLMLPYNGNGYDNLNNFLISHCYLHGVSTVWQDAGNTNRVVIEHSVIYDSRVTGADHQNIYWVASHYGTFRYNRVFNWNVEGLFFGGGSYGWEIYGNVFHDGVDVARAVEWPDGRNNRGHKIFNNTFVNLPLGAVYVYSSAQLANNEIRNNLLVNAPIYDNRVSGITLANNVTTNTAVFVDYANHDFRLKVPIPGAVLPGPQFAMDGDGKARGQDGVWDVGAYEYSRLGGTNPAIRVQPMVLDFGSATLGTYVTNSFTIQNDGSGLLVGTARISDGSTNSFQFISDGNYSLGPNQSQIIRVRYTPSGASEDNGTIECSGGGGAQIRMRGALQTVLPGLSFPANAGMITSPFVDDGTSISQPNEAQGVFDGGQATYLFEISLAGEYLISASVNAPSTSANSFYVNVDDQPIDPEMIWDIPPTQGFEERQVSWRGGGTDLDNQYAPKVFSLTAGTHQLVIRGREAGARLAHLTVLPYVSRPASPQRLRLVENFP